MRILGVCAGNGIMVHPFKESLIGNIEPRSDYKTRGNKQWIDNFDDIPLMEGIEDVRLKGVKPTAIIGHPSCGHSSSLAYSRGKKLGDAKREDSIKLFMHSLEVLRPKAFLFENLPNIYKSWPSLDADFEELGYTLVKYSCSMGHFGNSQISRCRLVIIGLEKSKNPLNSSFFELPKLRLSKLARVKELESGLNYPDAALCHIRESADKIVCMEKDFKKLTLAEIKKIWNSEKLLRKKKWDATTTGKGKMKYLPGVYRNLADDFPLTARKQNRQFNSEGDIMSPRELARIQGVPDSFKLHYEEKDSGYWINKARVSATKCPPYDLGKWFYEQLKKALKDEKSRKRAKAERR